MPGTAAFRLGRTRANVIVAIAAAVVVGALVLVGLQLRATQSKGREQLLERFHDRASVVSALMQAVIASAASSTNRSRYGTQQVDTATLDRTVAEGRLTYAVLLDRDGVIAQSSSLDAATRSRVLASQGTRVTLGGARVWLSDVEPGAVIELAVALDTPAGRRVLVSALPTTLFSAFLSSYLARVPGDEGAAYMTDSRGVVVASRDGSGKVGEPLTEPGLLPSLRGGTSGEFSGDRVFTTAPVPSSAWKIVLTAPEPVLLDSVSGPREWLPWLIYAALGILALAFLALLRRLVSSSTALSDANEQLAASNARLESSNALLRHAAELARSNAELEQFASIASHDLQEPLRKVQTFAAHISATEADRLSDEGQDFLRRMNAAAGRMRTLIDDLLMFSRVSTKGRPFVPVDLGDIVAQVLLDLEIGIQENGANVEIEALPTIAADPVQMRQLLQNLLGNALKFRRPGVTPHVTMRASVADGIAELTVADNGMGFEPQYATRIFRAFERLNGASAYPGTGIGLALCRKIVERHNGTITATSDLGEGATFTVRLPVEQPEQPAPAVPLLPEPIDEETSHALI